MPALRPDVAIVHAQEADRDGNVQLWGIPGVQKEAVLAADALARDRRADRRRARAAARRRRHPGLGDRRGGRGAGRPPPSYSHGITDRDNDFYRRWDTLSRDRDAFDAGCGSTCWSAPGRRGARTPRTAGDLGRGPDRRRRAPPRARQSVFIGVGRPSTAAILARMVHNPDLVLVYESGTIGAKPRHIPLSIGDGELAATADVVVSVPEMFNYWIGPGRIDVAFLGAAQVDRFGNLNSTVIGDYDHPGRACPAPAARRRSPPAASEVVVIAPHRRVRSSSGSTSSRPSATATGRATGSAGLPRPRPDGRDHRPRGAGARPRDRRADADADPRGRDRGPGARGDRLGPQRRRRPAHTPAPTDEELSALRELVSR